MSLNTSCLGCSDSACRGIASGVSRKPLLIAGLLLGALILSGCDWNVRRRSPGYLRLGKIQDLWGAENYLPEQRLLLRHDEGGFYVMSTECTHDLSALRLKDSPTGREFVSEYSASRYDTDGRVLSGPAEVSLPYYELLVDSGEYGGPKNTLYARVGSEVPPTWRLRIDYQSQSR